MFRPKKVDLLFERFISGDRGEPPDIDVDFEHERREEVIQHIYEKYGRERAGIAATVIRYRGRSAIREVGKVFGLSTDAHRRAGQHALGLVVEGRDEKGGATARPRSFRSATQAGDGACRSADRYAAPSFPARRRLRHHAIRLDEVVPIENAAMEERTVIEWEKNDLDAIGILKVDVLALGMLTCLRRVIRSSQRVITARHAISPEQDEDEATYNMI